MTGLKLRGDTAYLTDRCYKLQSLLHFHVGETITALDRAALTGGGVECIVYGTIMGTVAALCPFISKQEVSSPWRQAVCQDAPIVSTLFRLS